MMATEAGQSRFAARWVFLGAILVAALYIPSLSTRFDFIDDGNLVYPAPAMSAGERVARVWQRIVANAEHLGPFRPVLWVHWEIAADLFDGSARAWRWARLFWTFLAAAATLWLFRELGIGPGAALATTALALWTPFRNEIWTSLTLAEGVAMPYALAGLVCARRAARVKRAWPWEIAAALCALAALGCKNTFAVLVPAQVLLRVAPEGREVGAGLRRHAWRAVFLASTLALPIGHYIWFKLNWHPGQYVTPGPSLTFAFRFLGAILGGVSVDFMGLGLAVLGLALLVSRAPVFQHYRAACLTGTVLLVLGIGVYLPMGAIAGRYTMPAVWGLDLWIAAGLSSLPAVADVRWRRAALGTLAAGLAIVALTGLAKQEKFAARSRLLWKTLEQVERQAPPGAAIAWQESPQLNREEGIHFLWHLQARGRTDLKLCLFDAEGRRVQRVEVPATSAPATLMVTAQPTPPAPGAQLVADFQERCWGRHFRAYLWASR